MNAEQKESASLQKAKKGKLKIFFGYAAGTGKTYAMLEAGKAAQEKGTDVVIGYLEPHERPETLKKAEGLEWLPPKTMQEGLLEVSELDTDALIERKPQLALVDELAHTNAKDCRHVKRYQSVQELLMNGIDVYTTLNVQHLESLNDLVASITGILVSERIPDDVFDLADQVELIDIETDDLLERLREGKIYQADQARLAGQNFFTAENLQALRELALRRMAERVNRNESYSHAADHVLVCLSSSPSNARIIRSAARMAQAFQSRFTALYIQTPDEQDWEEADRARLQENMRLANRLGASIASAYGKDIAFQIGKFARLSHVTKIVLGRPGKKSAFSLKLPLPDQLAQQAPHAEIFIIPDAQIVREKHGHQIHLKKWLASLRGISIQAAILAVAFGCSLLMQAGGFSETSILIVFVFALITSGMLCTRMAQAVVVTLAGLVLFGFGFASPSFSLLISDPQYLLIFLVLFVLTLMTARISIALKNQASASAKAAALNTLLNEMSQNLQEMKQDPQICQLITREASAFLNRPIVVYPNEDGRLGKPYFSDDPGVFLDPKEQAVAKWTLSNNKRAGASTDTLSAARGLYLAIRYQHKVYGVIGIDLEGKPLDADQNTFLLSMLGQCALAMENHANAAEKEKKALEAEQEKLRSSLLRSISHDLRTPLTTIRASAQMLLEHDCSKAQTQTLTRTISDDALWLQDTVENLLVLTRLEDQNLHLNLEVTDMQEAVEAALDHVSEQKVEHPITVDVEDFCYAKVDGRLIVQMLTNLINNAIFHTAPGTPIRIACRILQDGDLEITVCDRGKGIPEEQQEHLFEPFGSTPTTITDSTRRMGLGLSIVRSIAEVHQGSVTFSDNHPGACFTVLLPCGKEVNHEALYPDRG